MSALVQVAGLVKEYGGRPGETIRVLSGVDLALDAASSLVVMGPSGSGKSTLLNIIGTLDTPTAGSVTFDGEDVHAFDGSRAAQFRNAEIGFVFQDHHLLPQCTALENVLVPCLASGSATAAQVERADKLLEQVGLANRATHRPEEMSGGQRQRVAMARALINEPRLVLCDEPTGNLDKAAGEEIARLLLKMRDQHGVAVLLVTHNADLASGLGRTLRLEGGILHE